MSEIRDEQYLGGGAYVGHDEYQIWLGANDHKNMTVALEPNAVRALMLYIHQKFPHVLQELFQ